MGYGSPQRKNEFSHKFCMHLSVWDPCVAYELHMESFLFDDLNYQDVLCSMPVSEHVSKQGGYRGMH